ncbi:NUDIX hydrolase [Rouxiella badensis]|jgi:phosphatase NudJ|uniref:Phosphatase NudJ n=1 Tax=Rouxiella badensis TaxID=1646377 RepID=A0A1X0WGD1_9GAMM|nr:NUDIX hydrolase [Rouxiella badensis]MCC3701289.1 NUDIX hydrolase [Rouxiella badensis]MCC3717716.1 NUDIX hydrolase [Rouxiella badensis]MCC3727340.1 NUDIX hydrolase [Rouxiella badensis]MCC3734967.1 NUDIX hydrolase [Rouxiella badensis]MCC3739059.1 NUDIX hydrolase [Rouxiella badensis]
MFRPNVTVACVVQAEGRFLLVEEIINNRLTLNQPAGHLEANETLLTAVRRELFEETGIDASPQFFLGLHQWQAPDETPFLRFTFVIDLAEIVPTFPQDSDISGCRWLTADEIFNAKELRSPLVAESIRLYQQPARYPLALFGNYNLPD